MYCLTFFVVCTLLKEEKICRGIKLETVIWLRQGSEWMMFAEILSPYQVLHIIDSSVCVYVCACMFVCVAESWTDIILIFTNHFVMKQTDAVHRWRNKPLIFSNGVWQLVFISYGVALSFWVYQSLWCVNIWDLFCQWLLTTEIDCFIKIPFCYINVSRLHFSFEQVYLVRFANVRPSNYS